MGQRVFSRGGRYYAVCEAVPGSGQIVVRLHAIDQIGRALAADSRFDPEEARRTAEAVVREFDRLWPPSPERAALYRTEGQAARLAFRDVAKGA